MPAPHCTTFALTPKRIHFIGISGIGMSALARLCMQRGWHVQGSTLAPNACTDALIAQGSTLFFNHSANHIDPSVECVVYSSAISENNPEMQAARVRAIPVMHRSDLVRAFVQPLRTIAISGTHGKTTTTSLLGHVLWTAQQDPLILSGGIMAPWNSPVYPGNGAIAVVEADESDHSHMNFSSLSGAILTNVEPDHLENYGGSLENIWRSFQYFLQLATHFSIVCSDAIDPKNPWLEQIRAPITFYGTGIEADFCASNIRTTAAGMRFDCQTPSGLWVDINLNLWGHHNVLNAVSVLATCVHLGLSEAAIRHGLAGFLGVARRLTHVGNAHGVPIIDDYAHHPTEISAVLRTLHDRGYQRILAICQPHRYTRLRDTMDAFSKCFQHAKTVALLPLYSAGEPVISGAESIDLGEKLTATGHHVILTPAVPECIRPLAALMGNRAYDVAICMGAGDITHVAKKLVQSIEHKDNRATDSPAVQP